MSENMFTAPKSYLEIALDRITFDNWLSDRLDDDNTETFTKEEIGDRLWQMKQNEKQLNQRREQWIARAKNKQRQIEADLKVRFWPNVRRARTTLSYFWRCKRKART